MSLNCLKVLKKTNELQWERKKQFTEDDVCMCVFTCISIDAPIKNKQSNGITMPGIKCINYYIDKQWKKINLCVSVCFFCVMGY